MTIHHCHSSEEQNPPCVISEWQAIPLRRILYIACFCLMTTAVVVVVDVLYVYIIYVYLYLCAYVHFERVLKARTAADV